MEGTQNCTAFGRCGGCSLLDVPYSEQLAAKDAEIANLFEGIAEHGAIRPIIGMDSPWHYRDKVIAPFAYGPRKGGSGARKGAGKTAGKAKGVSREIITGMYERGTHRIAENDGCLLENVVAQKVIAAILAIMRKHGVEPYDEDTGRGFLRHAVVRVGHESEEVLVTLVTNSEEFPHSKSFCRELVRRVPEVTSVVQNVNTRDTNVVLGNRERVLYGPGFILDSLCGMSFRISSRSFYQVNSKQTEALYRAAVDLAELQGGDLVIDAYCGTGTIGLVAAGMAREAGAKGVRVVGVDSEATSVRDARQNAKHNGIDDAEFVVADAADFLGKFAFHSNDGDLTVAKDFSIPAASQPSLEMTNESLPSFAQHNESEAIVISSGMSKANEVEKYLVPDKAPSYESTSVLFMDPPRAGASEEFLDAVAELAPDCIVYISCNPKTQVRDVKQLIDAGYAIGAVQPVDMFPHTDHIECIVRLIKVRGFQ